MTDFSFFKFSKLFWYAAAPDSILVALLLLVCLLLWLGAYKKARALFTFLLVIIIAITIFPVGEWVIYPLEKRFMPLGSIREPVDGIIMLGGAEEILESFSWKQEEVNHSSERFFAFIHLMKKYPGAKHVYAGGTGSLKYQELKGSEIARRLFLSQGIDPSGIIFEAQSRNTYENALFSKKILNPGPHENWILITSSFHMPRAYGIFTKLGWHVIPYPVDHLTNPDMSCRMTLNFSGNLRLLKNGMHEWAGLAAYYLTGKTPVLFPGPAG